MGVPALFRWLSQKYPKIISPVIETLPEEIDGEKIPIDISEANPNGEEFDNLYLDMNNIVHPCSHPEDRPPPADEQEMMIAVFEYTERIVNMVRPRKLLMIAVDGVAPRAKMNQQRSRRFRSNKEAKELDASKEELYKMLRAQGKEPEGEDGAPKKTWDSNAITPGTPFMDILARSLRYWISYKLSTDAAWKNLKIIISDATVPGEGEHKIMQFVRSQRSSPGHDPNTRHVIYGLDADLIMLCLGTHEPYFRVLREDVFASDSRPGHCNKCGQTGHMAKSCLGQAAQKTGDYDEKENAVPLKPFIWLHVGVLREYLAVEMRVPNQPFKFDLERALDDWVFMCFFVGNDFLPHLPSLEIREQGIDTLIAIWRDNLHAMGGYLTEDGRVNLTRAQLILAGLAKQEDAIFRRRRQVEQKKEASAKRRKTFDDRNNASSPGQKKGANGANASAGRKRGEQAPDIAGFALFNPAQAHTAQDPRFMTHDMVVDKANVANKSAAAVLKEQLKNKANGSETPGASSDVQTSTPTSALGKRTAEMMDDNTETPITDTSRPADGDEIEPDTVKLWEEGYADRYYEQKFKVSAKDIAFRHQVAKDYVEGLAWVLLYYFQGCPSWTWYYPHHYAPFAADFVDIGSSNVKFERGTPFHPYEQLMGVMPAGSKHTIPPAFHTLMTEPDSDIVDFYPEDFDIDLNGKKFAWQGVALLPFIDEKRLLTAMNTRYPDLDDDERARNAFGRDDLLCSSQHPLYEQISLNFYSKKAGAPKFTLKTKISDGLSGRVEKNDNFLPSSDLAPPLDHKGMPGLDEDRSMTVRYDMPIVNGVHKSMLLPNVTLPAPVLTRGDIEQTASRSQRTGREFGGVPLGNQSGPQSSFSYGPGNNNHGHGGNSFNNRGGGRAGGQMGRPYSMPDMRGNGSVQPLPQMGRLPVHMAGWQPGQPMPLPMGVGMPPGPPPGFPNLPFGMPSGPPPGFVPPYSGGPPMGNGYAGGYGNGNGNANGQHGQNGQNGYGRR